MSDKRTKQQSVNTGAYGKSSLKPIDDTLHESQGPCCALVDDAGVAMLLADNKANILAANKTAAELTGYIKADLLGLSASKLPLKKYLERLFVCVKEKSFRSVCIVNNLSLIRKDKKMVHVALTGHVAKYKGKRIYQILVNSITKHTASKKTLPKTKEHMEQIYNVIPSAIFTTDTSSVLTSFNKAAEEITGYSADEVLGKKCTIFAVGACALGCGLFQCADEIDEPITGKVCEIKRKDGELRIISKNMDIIRDVQGNVVGGVESFEDITERKKAEETIKHMAYYDSLTGLPNRTLFNDRLSVALAHTHRSSEKLAVLFLDLDNFKIVNDTLGHAAGDQLLQGVAERLRKCVRIEDTVARFGGDEFVILLSRIDNSELAATFARRLLEKVEPPFNLEGRDFHVTTSIGIAIYPNDGVDCQTILKNADIALYSAKMLGRNNYQFYKPTMNNEALASKNSVCNALDNRNSSE